MWQYLLDSPTEQKRDVGAIFFVSAAPTQLAQSPAETTDGVVSSPGRRVSLSHGERPPRRTVTLQRRRTVEDTSHACSWSLCTLNPQREASLASALTSQTPFRCVPRSPSLTHPLWNTAHPQVDFRTAVQCADSEVEGLRCRCR
jgi:hypothetical protein